MAPKRNLPLNVERTPAGSFRARTEVDGSVVRGRSRETKNEAAEDALALQRNLVVDRGRPQTVREAFDTIFAWCEDADRRAAARLAWLVNLSKEWRQVGPRATLHRLREALGYIRAGPDPPVPIPVVEDLLGHQATTAAGIRLYARPAETTSARQSDGSGTSWPLTSRMSSTR